MLPDKLLDWFKVDKYPGVYVLGSFARHVTLYSQQVRALNLVFALAETGVISEKREVVVIGGGAAGLTAAAAAAKKQAKVLLLEELDGLMELQRNNRQRWLHPYIYDWPDGPEDLTTDLPLLNWTAGYAEQVASTLEMAWRSVKDAHDIKVEFNVKNVRIISDGVNTELTWKGGRCHNPVIIIAVGFGLEPHSKFQESYWTEDDFDGSFRKSLEGQTWLVSGFGDGAFTDLMRLCIKRFRHANIASMFSKAEGIHDVREQLREMHAQPNPTPEFLTKSFHELPLRSLVDILQPQTRKLEVFLTGPNAYPYGAKASILNRLVVCVLEKMGAFTFMAGPIDVKKIKTTRKGYMVPIGEFGPQSFNRVILRHGPEPPTLRASFLPIWKASAALQESWRSLNGDETHKRMWSRDFFGPETAPTSTEAEHFGVRAGSLTISKELRNDSISSVKYEVKDLAVFSGALMGMRFFYQSTLGQVGKPELDTSSQHDGFWWEDDPEPPQSGSLEDFNQSMAAVRKRLRKLAGTVRFPIPLKPGMPPLSFTLSFMALNADAFSSWEFEQLYEPGDRVHVNGDPLEHAMEYMARIVWFPMEHLKLRLTLPSRTPGPPFGSLFELQHDGLLPADQVVRDGVLQLYPPHGSPWALSSKVHQWKRRAVDSSSSQVTQITPETWEFSVTRPHVGRCYSLDWRLPSSIESKEAIQIENETSRLREQLLAYRSSRLKADGDPAIRRIFQDLYAKVKAKYGHSEGDERFALSMLTYDENKRVLTLVDGVVNGGDPSKEMWDFWLPFGAGLAGACFKQQPSDPFIYFAPEKEEKRMGPESYLPFPNRESHKVLVAVPLNHPRAKEANGDASLESSRQRVAVLDIGSNSENTKLYEFRGANRDANFAELVGWCNEFRDALCNYLAPNSASAAAP